MKRSFLILAFIVCLLMIALAFILTSRKISILPGYDVLFTRSLGKGLVLYGLTAKEGEKSEPLSLIAVYRGKDIVYRFSPIVPARINYPRPLRLERAEVIKEGEEVFVLTSWGETGADYFGTHPILIRYTDGKFRAISFYKSDLSADARIKGISWTRRDFYVRNYFDNSERVKTILTQGASVTREHEIELSFYGDELPHAAEHKMVRILLPLLPQPPSKL